jgi:seryl-tRNA synthetase
VIDVKQSAKTSGSRFSYLKGDLVLLQYALQQIIFNELIKRGYNSERAAKALLALAVSVFLVGVLFIGSDS